MYIYVYVYSTLTIKFNILHYTYKIYKYKNKPNQKHTTVKCKKCTEVQMQLHDSEKHAIPTPFIFHCQFVVNLFVTNVANQFDGYHSPKLELSNRT